MQLYPKNIYFSVSPSLKFIKYHKRDWNYEQGDIKKFSKAVNTTYGIKIFLSTYYFWSYYAEINVNKSTNCNAKMINHQGHKQFQL